ncbi:MAG: DUF1778 domain-containing protein [bacterium]|nr:DUF1778 domain-containing protein [bacterium]
MALPGLQPTGDRGRSPKRERIAIRANSEEKALFQRAADLETKGDLSAFILASAEARAKLVLRSYEETELHEAERERFYAFLANPPEPSEALVALFAESPSFKVVS